MSNTYVRRETPRKRRVRELLESRFEGGPVLLEELRWAVWDAETRAENKGEKFATRSWMNSFARTIREQFPNLQVQKILINDATPVGLIARAALFRLKEPDQLRAFLQSKKACVLCRFQTRLYASEPRFHARYVTPYFHAATFRFFEERPMNLSYETIRWFPGTFIPATQKLSMVAARGSEADLRALANVPWTLLGYDQDLNDRYEVDPVMGLAAVERDSRP